MGILENMKEVADLVKKVGDVELYRRIVELEGEVIDLTRSNRELEERIAELGKALEFKQKLIFHDGFYWIDGEKDPFCPGCWESKHLAVHVVFSRVKDMGSSFLCPSCKTIYRHRML